jgi:hypothetical protein
MQTCKSCERVRFFSINFIFSKTICNECYMLSKSQYSDTKGNHEHSNDDKQQQTTD